MTKPPNIDHLAEEGGVAARYTFYNGMIAPLVPYGFRRALWYEGEAKLGRRLIFISNTESTAAHFIRASS